MPKLKQLSPLRKLAFDILVMNVVRCCVALGDAYLIKELHQAVADIRNHVHDKLPINLFVKFCNKFLKDFYDIAKYRWGACEYEYCEAAVVMIMDVKMFGVISPGNILHFVDPSDLNRIHGLTELDWGNIWTQPPISLKDLQLQDLTSLRLQLICTDPYLEIIGSRCPNLRVLCISKSRLVTDRGLRALSPCSNLRVIHILYCSVTEEGVNELLNTHEKLESLSLSDTRVAFQYPTVYPSIKRFTLQCRDSKYSAVHCALAAFPNLTSLELRYSLPYDFSMLKDLKNLTELVLIGDSVMAKLRPTLMHIGKNILVLSIDSDPVGAGVSQNDLDFIFKTCCNLEHLSFDYLARRLTNKLVIPSFKKLITLKMFPGDDEFFSHLEFAEMPALEQFSILAFDHISDVIDSMLLDNVKFPNLKIVEVGSDGVWSLQRDRINQIAKDRNIDFSVKD